MEEKGSGGVGVELIKELTGDLNEYMERKGYNSIEELRGVARDRIVEHAQVRRKSGNITAVMLSHHKIFQDTALPIKINLHWNWSNHDGSYFNTI